MSSVVRPYQHNIGYMGDGFYRSKDPTKVLKEMLQKRKKTRSQAVARIADRTAKNCRGHVT